MTVEICESSLTLDAAPRSIDRLDQRVGIGGTAHSPACNLSARRVQPSALSGLKSITVRAGWSQANRPVGYLLNDVSIQGRWGESAPVSGGTGERSTTASAEALVGGSCLARMAHIRNLVRSLLISPSHHLHHFVVHVRCLSVTSVSLTV